MSHGDQSSDEPTWDPILQIYVGGKIPENGIAVQKMMQDNGGWLRIFGYGSLCWNPGGPDESLAHATVTSTTGKARGYRRVWAQKSTDHRGLPQFPGIVCTLLTDAEYYHLLDGPDAASSLNSTESFTEGVIYLVPPDLADQCLEELDFREKGGYAREVIDVVQDCSGTTVQALLYRGTPDNPAFWPRALRDLPFAAAVISVAIGPSGDNLVYLNRLDEFLRRAAPTASELDDTVLLSKIARTLQHGQYDLHFLCGCGSNQHNQLLLRSESNWAALSNDGEDAHEMKEIVVCTPRTNDDSRTAGHVDPIVDIFAGGGHTGVLTRHGRLFAIGWNHLNQLGSSKIDTMSLHECCRDKVTSPWLVLSEFPNFCVSMAAFGFAHTLFVERDTGRLYGFGDNSSGQVNGRAETPSLVAIPELMTSRLVSDEPVTALSAGVFHSAAITASGALVTFGSNRFEQTLAVPSPNLDSVGKWSPQDESKLTKVACGRGHTVVLDDKGRVWTFGDNKYSQLGRTLPSKGRRDSTPTLVSVGDDMFCYDVKCGWSHNVVLAKDSSGRTHAWGWGRNDKGQLGTSSKATVASPVQLFRNVGLIRAIDCGSESTVVVDAIDTIWSCGWNEHGNLATGSDQDSLELTQVTGAPIVTTPGYDIEQTRLVVAAGGATLIAMRVSIQ